MMNFCTLFDSYYIHKGIATYLSLSRVTNDFHLYVMAFDKDSYAKLNALGFDHMTVELVDDFETSDLLEVKPTRNKAEYCWTCGSAVTWHFMNKYNLSDITYLDSDLFFLSDPKIIFDEIGERSIAVTEHNNIDSTLSGRFCVQFMYFKNDEEGRSALKWWRDSCVEWCFDRYEDGKYGDQRYVDQFPQRYKSLCVVKNLGAGIGPWNMNRYQFTDHTLKFNDREDNFVFFHMHGIKSEFKGDILVLRCVDCILNNDTQRLFFEPYAELLLEVYNKYLGKQVNIYKIVRKSKRAILWSRIKYRFRTNPIAKWLYKDVLKVKYQGNEQKQI